MGAIWRADRGCALTAQESSARSSAGGSARVLGLNPERDRTGQCRHVEVPAIDVLPEADGQVGGGLWRRDVQVAGTDRAAAVVRPCEAGPCRLAGRQVEESAAGVVRVKGAAPVGDRLQDPVTGVQ